MDIKELIYRFKLEYDKLDSNDYPKLELPQIIMLLNKAQTLVVKTAFDPDDNIGKGFEIGQLSIDDLSVLHIKDNPLLTAVKTTTNPNEYSVNLKDLKYPYLHLTRSYSYGHNDICGTQILDNYRVTNGELNEVLKDENRKPDFYWQQVPVNIAQSKLLIYTDGTFDIKKVKVEYIREPVKMDIQGYTKFDGSPSTNVDCELPEYVQERILSMTLLIAKGIFNDVTGVQINEKQLLIQQ